MSEAKFVLDVRLKCHVWKLNGKLHRDGDLPAIEARGFKKWYQHDVLHRDGDMPACIYENGDMEWFKQGKFHRDFDRPAVEYADGSKRYYQHGKLHRDGDQPAWIDPSGKKMWFQHGQLHREGSKPAFMDQDGFVEYWENGLRVSLCWSSMLKTDDMNGRECAITFEVIEQHTSCGLCSTCNKVVSFDALRQWLRINNSCPNCRSPWENRVEYMGSVEFKKKVD
jgi:hypothetical protein